MALNSTVVDLSDDSTVIATGKCYLHGIMVAVVMSNHVCPIEDASGQVFTQLAATSAAGTHLDCFGALMDGITVDPHNDATGTIVVVWSS